LKGRWVLKGPVHAFVHSRPDDGTVLVGINVNSLIIRMRSTNHSARRRRSARSS
jgi:hypothetical protein